MARTARIAAAFVLSTGVLGGVAAAQAQQGMPGVPPSVQQEIDRALSRVPEAHRPAMPGRPAAGQPQAGTPDVDSLIRSAGANASRRVSLGFENKTPYKALVIQFAPVGSGAWGENRLRRETLNPRAIMSWPLNTTECRYDVRITFALGNEFVRLDHDFCAQDKIEVTSPEPTAAPLPARPGVALFRVVNRSNEKIAVLRVTPVGAARPQPDLLGIWMMEHGDTYTGRVARGGNCLYDVRVGFDPEDTQSVTLSRQNLCETPELVVPARRATGG